MRAVEILLVEDNPGDVRLTREAFKDVKLTNSLHVVGDGIAALEFLRREGRFEGSPAPDLVLLDLNLPLKDGREVLQEMRQCEVLRAIPVAVLTASHSHREMLESDGLQADCYLVKPLDFGQLCRVVESIEQFGFTMVRFAPESG